MFCSEETNHVSLMNLVKLLWRQTMIIICKLTLRNDIKQHAAIMEDINSSNLDSLKNPFLNTIFVNYTTQELEPALKFNRIKFCLCDYIDQTNIEVLKLVSPININFMRKSKNNSLLSLNS